MNLRRHLSAAAHKAIAPLRTASLAASAAFKAASMVFSGYGGQGWSYSLSGGTLVVGTLPGSERNLALDAGDPWLNPVVSAGIGWIGDNFGEPEAQVQERRGKKYEPIDDHDLIRLIEDPNGEYDSDALWFATVLSFVVSGTAYWVKAKAKSGKTLELWWVPSWEIQPHWNTDGRSFIDGYWHVVDGRRIPLQKEDVVPFRHGLDPNNPRRGLPQLGGVFAEIATDNAGTVYQGAILRNMGMPGILITPASASDTIERDEAEVIKQMIIERTTGDNRGKPVVLSAPLKVERLSMSPEDLALDRIRNVPECRICSALKLSPMVLSLPSAAGYATFANFQQATAGAYQSCLIPLQKSFAKTLTRQLLIPDFGGVPGKHYFEWNYDNVKAMEEDAGQRAERASKLFTAGVIKRGKACEMVGVDLPPKEEDVYVFEAQQQQDKPASASQDVAGGDNDGEGPPVGNGTVNRVAALLAANGKGDHGAAAAVATIDREAALLDRAERLLRRAEETGQWEDDPEH